MEDIDRTYEGALREIHRLCGVVEDLKRDNKFIQERLQATINERNVFWQPKRFDKWCPAKGACLQYYEIGQ